MGSICDRNQVWAVGDGPLVLHCPPLLSLGYLEEERWKSMTSQEVSPACIVFSHPLILN